MTIYLKAKLANAEEAKEILLFLGAVHVATEIFVYEYFQIDEDTVTFIRTAESGKSDITLAKTIKDTYKHLTREVTKDVDEERKTLAKKYGPPVTFAKKKARYAVKGIDISLSTIQGIGTFLELETDQYDYQELKEYVKKFGLTAKDIDITTYNKILSRKKLSVKR